MIIYVLYFSGKKMNLVYLRTIVPCHLYNTFICQVFFFSSDFFEIEILCMHFGIVSVCACFLWISNPYRWCHRCLVIALFFCCWVCFQYGIVLDAGSSHTSMFIYKWPADKQNGTGIVSEHSKCRVNGE